MIFSDIINFFTTYFTDERLSRFLNAAIILILGFILGKVVSISVASFGKDRLTKHQQIIIKRFVFYAILAIFLLAALHELGLKLSVVLGAAGVLSVALGFAAQTSMSNFISGLFLIGEKPFAIGDIIKVGDSRGEVLSIDWLSVKLRTFDNLFVRIPNETLIKSEITNLTKFPIRRLDLSISVAYKENIANVKEKLFAVAHAEPLCLEEPQPLFIVLGFGESSIDIQFSVWTTSENFLILKNKIQESIKQCFDESGIEIPYPCRNIYAGSTTAPLSIKIVKD